MSSCSPATACRSNDDCKEKEGEECFDNISCTFLVGEAQGILGDFGDDNNGDGDLDVNVNDAGVGVGDSDSSNDLHQSNLRPKNDESGGVAFSVYDDATSMSLMNVGLRSLRWSFGFAVVVGLVIC